MIEARNAVADLLDNRTLAELRAQTNLRARAYILRLKRPHIPAAWKRSSKGITALENADLID
jgi:hypothetical protein